MILVRAALTNSLVVLVLAGACSGKSSPVDAGPDAGPECLVAADCTLDDGDPCTETQCVEGACALQRRTPALTQIAFLSTPTPARSVDFRGTRLLVSEDSAGVGEYQLDASGLTETHRYPTTKPAQRVRGLSGHVLVSEGPGGIEAFQNGDPVAQSIYLGPDQIAGLVMVNELVFGFAYAKGLDIIDYTDWAVPLQVTTVNTRGRVYDVIGWDKKILLADGLAGVASMNFEDPRAPVLDPKPVLLSEGRVVALSRRGNLLALAESGAGASLVDLSAKDGPVRFASLDLGGPVVDADLLSAHTALFAASDGGLAILDLLDLESVTVWIREVPGGPVLDLSRDGEKVALALGASGVAIYDLRCTPPQADGGP